MNFSLHKIFILLLFYLFILSCFNTLYSQNWTVTNSGSVGSKKFVDIDKNVNVYSYFNSYPPVDFGDTVCTEGRMYLVKYDSSGLRQWLSEIKASWAAWGDMLVDSAGNIYISGVFSDTIALADTTLILYGDFYHELFLAKFNTDGVLQWARRSDKANDSSLVGTVSDLAFSGFDDNGNIQLMLYYIGNLVVLGNDSLYGDGYDHALARIDTNGNFIWNKLINNGAYDFKPALIDPNGNFFLNGTYTSPFPDQSFILKFDFSDTSEWYDASETYLWRELQEGEIVGFDSDTFNNAYAVIRVNADTFFLKKYTQNGSLNWKERINLKPGNLQAFSINKTGNIIIAAANDTIPNYSPLYIEKYDSSGNWLGKIYLGTRINNLLVSSVVSRDILLDNNNIYVVGDYNSDTGNAIVFIDDTVAFSLYNGPGVFVTKFHSSQLDTIPLGIFNFSFADNAVMFYTYPNPFSQGVNLLINPAVKGNYFISIFNLHGKIIYYAEIKNLEQLIKIQVDLHSHPSGIYIFQVKTNNNIHNLKILKQ